jgi:hypothetical protein
MRITKLQRDSGRANDQTEQHVLVFLVLARAWIGRDLNPYPATETKTTSAFVQIMTPAYKGDPEQPKVVPRTSGSWRPPRRPTQNTG